jgi:DNA-directed RNA polymerase subunit alpha
MLNFKDVIFKNTFISKNKHYELKQKGYLHVKGPVIVTAGMLKLPRYLLKVINPQQYICTIVDDSELYIEIDIEKGKGYRLAEENRKNKIEKKLSSIKPSTLFIDSMFIPIKRVNYKIKLIHDTKGNIKESLNFEILTNGSITPKRSLQESLKVLLNLFYPLFLNPNFFEISDKVIKKLE